MNRRWLLGAAGVAVVVIVGIAMASGDGSTDVDANGSPLEFEEVARRDLEEVTTLAGTLGFPEGDPVTSRLKGTITDVADSGAVVAEGGVLFTVDGEPVVFLQGTQPAYREIGSDPILLTVRAQSTGTVTELPEVDELIGFSEQAFRIDDVPVFVLSGSTPAWRDLYGYYKLDRRGDATDEWVSTSGTDVEQFEAALDALGYGDGRLVVDEYYTEYTGTIVREWQEDAGLTIDGQFGLADAFFAPSAPTVVEVLVGIGDAVSPGTPIMVVRTHATQVSQSIITATVGDSGDEVEVLQGLLDDRGYDVGTVDGAFGASTETAVAAFQAELGLASTGIVDEATWAALVADTDSEQAADDVLQLQEALARLGYDVPTDGIADDRTAAAIEQWQADLGSEVDGVVDLGEVIFLPEPVRITEAMLNIGSPVNDGSAVLATSSSASVVLVDLPADDQDLLTVGLELTVEMPDGTEVGAVVTEISGIAVRRESGDVVFETTIELLDTTVGAELDQAPVDVLVVTDARRDVLAVPVTALLALAEGGYAIEVERADGSLGLVAATPGLYADGWVEVDSDGLEAGDRVVVP
jgi:peptidoglycan hydrolase-like protein with peptidoglycan-binding domain